MNEKLLLLLLSGGIDFAHQQVGTIVSDRRAEYAIIRDNGDPFPSQQCFKCTYLSSPPRIMVATVLLERVAHHTTELRCVVHVV